MKENIIGGVAVLALVIAFLGLSGKKTVEVVEKIVGGGSPQHFELQEFEAGVKYGNNIATSTPGSATLTVGELKQWVDADTVVVTPTGANEEKVFTFPASSTAQHVLPQAGDSSKTCIHNATTGPSILLAGGTGTPINVASSSATALGSLRISAGEYGCITWVRGGVTSTTFDIVALFTAFK